MDMVRTILVPAIFIPLPEKRFFTGNATLKFGGVGYPMIEVPKDFGEVSQNDRPKIDYTTWEDGR